MQHGVILIERILGPRSQPDLACAIHRLEHHGGVEMLAVAPADLPRRRFRAATDLGTDCAIALPRDVRLFDGAVLHLDEHRAIILKVGEQAWLRLRPAVDAGLELGHLAGNLHWRVRFEAGDLLVALDHDREGYLARLAGLVGAGRVTIVDG
jgi:urease accessory protein